MSKVGLFQLKNTAIQKLTNNDSIYVTIREKSIFISNYSIHIIYQISFPIMRACYRDCIAIQHTTCKMKMPQCLSADSPARDALGPTAMSLRLVD
jgi:branched-subunit amino acid permease